MDNCTCEQALRQEAIRRRPAGEQRREICRDLRRSTSWLDKWWAVYRETPHSDVGNRSRAPLRSPHQMPAPVIQPVVSLRRALEAAQTADTKYGLVGNRAIQGRCRN